MPEIKTSEEARKNIEEFTKRYLNLEEQKKELQEDVKALKDEFKEEGVPVQIVCAVISLFKKLKKKTDSQKFEEETILEWIMSNPEIDNKVGKLISN